MLENLKLFGGNCPYLLFLYLLLIVLMVCLKIHMLPSSLSFLFPVEYDALNACSINIWIIVWLQKDSMFLYKKT